ncbi:M20 aminoacylase family protein [Variovorax sp. J31P207]|uniref:M20 aminoacylase family protein n=1 Tax=Variovorax sp. J31P207 TaxID=3053510 RepID=UPI002575BC13|nr:M20 aminoacylase family protein [Variovorax sp. J31P207]MDM0071406.1 M20 aminoacylase family protein [Variovorax sp. J31P207]
MISVPIHPGIQASTEEMVGLRRQIHANPELGYEEFQTSELVAQRLARWGYAVHRGLGGTGVVGSLKLGQGGKRLGLRADMDALPMTETTGLSWASRKPGAMHACGHDGHTATLLAAAQVLAAAKGFDGTLNLIFQPAEEGLMGAKKMVEDGLFERFPCDAVYAYHNEPGFPAGQFGFLPGVIYSSSDTVVITIEGKGGHGAMPHTTVDPIMVAAHLILALQTLVSREVDPNDMAVVTVGAMNAGKAPNVIPTSAELKLSVRARRPEVRAFLRERITAMARGQAAVHGASAVVDYQWKMPPCVNDAAATDFARQVALASMGEKALIPDMAPLQASDDFAFMLDAVPGSYFIVGNGDGKPGSGPGCMVHNTGYDFNDEILPSTASYWVSLVQAYLR